MLAALCRTRKASHEEESYIYARSARHPLLASGEGCQQFAQIWVGGHDSLIRALIRN